MVSSVHSPQSAQSVQTARKGDEFWKGIGQSPRNVEFEAGGSGEGEILDRRGLDYTPC
jgi:hypothetical protein